MIKKGVYAAGLSVLNADRTLDIDATINHASEAIQSGLHGVFFFGSTGQSQLISSNEKKELIAKIASHKLRKQFFLGTGNNSLNENIDLIKYAMEYDFKYFLINALIDLSDKTMNFKYKDLAKKMCAETINKFYLSEKDIFQKNLKTKKEFGGKNKS